MVRETTGRHEGAVEVEHDPVGPRLGRDEEEPPAAVRRRAVGPVADDQEQDAVVVERRHVVWSAVEGEGDVARDDMVARAAVVAGVLEGHEARLGHRLKVASITQSSANREDVDGDEVANRGSVSVPQPDAALGLAGHDVRPLDPGGRDAAGLTGPRLLQRRVLARREPAGLHERQIAGGRGDRGEPVRPPGVPSGTRGLDGGRGGAWGHKGDARFDRSPRRPI